MNNTIGLINYGIAGNIHSIKKAIEKEIPIMRVCLRNQIMGLAAGANTYKLKYGHRSANQPVLDLENKNKCYITSQNHGYAVVAESFPDESMYVTHINMNDNTVEGIKYKNIPLFTVQFHPEASPGPKDNGYLFEEFMTMITKWKKD